MPHTNVWLGYDPRSDLDDEARGRLLGGAEDDKVQKEKVQKDVSCMEVFSNIITLGDRVSIRFLAAIGAVAVIAVGVKGLILPDGVDKVFLCVELLLLGMVILMLEADFLLLSGSMRTTLAKYTRFLCKIWGRAMLYLLVASLCIVEWHFFDVVVGIYMLCLCVFAFVCSMGTAAQLNRLRREIGGSDKVERAEQVFAEFCNKDKEVMATDFNAYLQHLNVKFSKNEIACVILALDLDQSGSVSKTEFTKWWNGGDLSFV